MKFRKPSDSRRKILLLGATLLSGAALLSSSLFRRKRKETVKMLTQDGKLVEVEVTRITGRKDRISNQQLQHWINKT